MSQQPADQNLLSFVVEIAAKLPAGKDSVKVLKAMNEFQRSSESARRRAMDTAPDPWSREGSRKVWTARLGDSVVADAVDLSLVSPGFLEHEADANWGGRIQLALAAAVKEGVSASDSGALDVRVSMDPRGFDFEHLKKIVALFYAAECESLPAVVHPPLLACLN